MFECVEDSGGSEHAMAITDGVQSSIKRDKIVAGAGFEPAVPRMRDYEPFTWIRLSSPKPPFCRLSLFSNFLASERFIGLLSQTIVQGPLPLVQREIPELCWSRRVTGSFERPMYFWPAALLRT